MAYTPTFNPDGTLYDPNKVANTTNAARIDFANWATNAVRNIELRLQQSAAGLQPGQYVAPTTEELKILQALQPENYSNDYVWGNLGDGFGATTKTDIARRFGDSSVVGSPAYNEAQVAAGNLIKVPVGNSFSYIPAGSAAAANLPNIGTNNTANAANAVPPPILSTNQVDPTLASFNQQMVGSDTQQPVTNQAGVNTTGANAASSSTVDLPPEYQALYTQLEEYLKKLQAVGKVVNPNVVIDPSKLAEFTAQAKNEIDPYYANQLKVAKDQFLTSLGYSRESLEANEKQLEKQYKQQLRTLGESAAEQGFAQSGLRRLDEQNLASQTQFSLDQARRSLANTAGTAASSFAGQFGTSNLPTMNFSPAPRVLQGEGSFSRALETPIYNLSPETYAGLTGTSQFQNIADVRNRASQLETSYRSNLANEQLRQLTL